jgi:hypothetical protein
LITQALLKTYIPRRGAKCTGRLAGKHGQNPFLFLVPWSTVTPGEGIEEPLVVVALTVNDALPFARVSRKRREGMIDNGDIIGIMQHTAVGIQSAEYPFPEGNIGT